MIGMFVAKDRSLISAINDMTETVVYDDNSAKEVGTISDADSQIGARTREGNAARISSPIKRPAI